MNLQDVIKFASQQNQPAQYQPSALSGLQDASRDLSRFDRTAAAGLEDQVLAEAGPRRIGDVVSNLNQATAGANRISEGSAGIYERQVRGLGANMSASAKRSATRRLGLSRALVSVDSRQRAIEGMRQRTDIARSAAGDLRNAMEGQALDMQSRVAGMETDREVTYQGEMAKYKQDKAAGLGQLASMAAMFIPGVGPLVAPAIGGAVTKAAL